MQATAYWATPRVPQHSQSFRSQILSIGSVSSGAIGNSNGVGASNGGVLQSYGTNQINGNSNDGIASLTPMGLH